MSEHVKEKLAELQESGIDVRALQNEICRRHLYVFVTRVFNTLLPNGGFLTNWHIDAICHQLERVFRGEVKRLIINLPPRSGKSIIASVAFPAFVLGHDPTKRIICVSYGEDLAAQLARDSRLIMQQGWYRSVFPRTRLSAIRSAELDFETTRRGGRLSMSMGGSLTGRGASLIIVDDPQKAEAFTSQSLREAATERFTGTVISRLDNQKDDAIVVIQQRLHVDDLTGELLRKGGWETLRLPAIASHDQTVDLCGGRTHLWKEGEVLHPARADRGALDQTRREVGSFTFQAQFLQDPQPPEGNLFKAGWLKRYTDLPEGGRVVQSWDLAVRDGDANDYCVCVTALVDGNSVYVIDVLRKKLDFPGQKNAIVDNAKRHDAHVILVEKAATGDPIIDTLRHEKGAGIPSPTGVRPKGSKIERARLQSPRFEAGDVFLPKHADWLDPFEAELLAFPNGRHDDQVDAITQLLYWDQKHNDGPSLTPMVGSKLLLD